MAERTKSRADKASLDEHFSVEKMSADVDALAEGSVRVCSDTLGLLQDDPSKLIEKSDSIELQLRNPAVLINRIKTGLDIKVPSKYLDEVSQLETRVSGLLDYCGVSHEEYKTDGNSSVEALQRAVMDRKLPEDSASMVAAMLMRGATLFSDVVSDSGTRIEPGLQNYLAGNVRAAASSSGLY